MNWTDYTAMLLIFSLSIVYVLYSLFPVFFLRYYYRSLGVFFGRDIPAFLRIQRKPVSCSSGSCSVKRMH